MMKKANKHLYVKKPSRLARPRHDWEAKFKEMASKKDDILLDEPVLTTWDKSEWEWNSSAQDRSAPLRRNRC